jgi:hypothetical protein
MMATTKRKTKSCTRACSRETQQIPILRGRPFPDTTKSTPVAIVKEAMKVDPMVALRYE